MKNLQLALAQINTKVGDFKGNSGKILSFCQKAVNKADLIVFPELAISGYSPKDLLVYKDFIEREAQTITALLPLFPKNLAVLFGHLREENGKFFNSLSLFCDGKLLHRQDKILRPSYNVFHENRYFHAGELPHCLNFKGIKLGFAICEDIAYRQFQQYRPDYVADPLENLCQQGAECLIVVAASPLELTHNLQGQFSSKLGLRKYLISHYQRAACYVNLVGGNDEIIFDGQSFALNAQGEVLQQLPLSSECLSYLSLPIEEALPLTKEPEKKVQVSAGKVLLGHNFNQLISGVKQNISKERYYEQLHKSLLLGLRDYVKKSGFDKVHLGLSGGIDSALVTTLAVQALGSDNVRIFALPSRYNSMQSYSDAQELAKRLGLNLEEMNIDPLYQDFLKTLQPYFADRTPDLSEENLQARIRGLLMMAISNKFSSLLLLTGNKSEFATGYATLYGDMCGALAVIGDLFKSDVFALCSAINVKNELIPLNILQKEPSAELRAEQKDSDSLPPYHLLDQLLYQYLNEGKEPQEIVVKGLDMVTVQQLISRIHSQEFKRFQAAPILKVSNLSFGSGRLIPLARSKHHHNISHNG